MPVKKTLTRSKSKQKKNWREGLPKFFLIPKNLIIIGLLILVLLFWLGRNYFIVASVNGQPISRFELNSRLNTQFGQAILDQLINERLLLGAARQQGIFITAEEIEKRIKEIEKSLDGKMSLRETLSLQGLTPNTFRRQLELQLSIEKLFSDKATVSASEIDDYLENNKNLFPQATDPAKLRQEVEGFIKQQKMGKLYEEWFNNIKKDAKITRRV
ncbi:hypothetical protein A3D78_02220 [Candidatus Gottesmanbacteria bacterium RIFCSPHIGHO2_02_FULL_39_14]|uniref:peptidylprolyl isomerase n=3 Tax=Candidatus Gottesmaniibacteriota TaxID=1752720 RepID=A0A1F6A2B5_9BACT|nr:MAG: hypothetical protein A2153_02030 [Candidatus Gottesmanbacteria bacterium RBG_16_38_7b]OGG18808.1 MAG: hypothetical protein A3D78_02220 [Candidatus Gottesmanbacteria bacterium RIFCSPHIGHO2_02_FULL_39_14]OGG31950.1 MAG: hypothetical protein A3I51_00065 [Candidatus Gottesmanbacteria bacterium RIFCSPLOWO2_02_FULL_38_8]